MDAEQLHNDICTALPYDLTTSAHSVDDLDSHWKQGDDGLLRQNGKIYVLDAEGLRLKVVQYKHDHILSGHFSQNKTLKLIQVEYTWPGMCGFVKDFCKTCVTCGHSKTPRHKLYILLKQLPVLDLPWNSISMDFIEQLLESTGFTTIFVVMDCLSKQSIFIPTVETITITAQ